MPPTKSKTKWSKPKRRHLHDEEEGHDQLECRVTFNPNCKPLLIEVKNVSDGKNFHVDFNDEEAQHYSFITEEEGENVEEDLDICFNDEAACYFFTPIEGEDEGNDEDSYLCFNEEAAYYDSFFIEEEDGDDDANFDVCFSNEAAHYYFP